MLTYAYYHLYTIYIPLTFIVHSLYMYTALVFPIYVSHHSLYMRILSLYMRMHSLYMLPYIHCTCPIYVHCVLRSISEISSCFLGPRPWHIEIRHRVKQTSTINSFGFETLELNIRRLKLWKPTVYPLKFIVYPLYMYMYMYMYIYIYIYIYVCTLRVTFTILEGLVDWIQRDTCIS